MASLQGLQHMISKPVGAGADAGPKVADEKLFVTMTESQLEMEVRVRNTVVDPGQHASCRWRCAKRASPPPGLWRATRASHDANAHAMAARRINGRQ